MCTFLRGQQKKKKSHYRQPHKVKTLRNISKTLTPSGDKYSFRSILFWDKLFEKIYLCLEQKKPEAHRYSKYFPSYETNISGSAEPEKWVSNVFLKIWDGKCIIKRNVRGRIFQTPLPFFSLQEGKRSKCHGNESDVTFYVNEFPAVTKTFSAVSIPRKRFYGLQSII